MIQELIDYINNSIPITVKESNTTNSHYIELDNKESIRISDHFSYREKIKVQVIIPETPENFIISINDKVYCYTSLSKVGDFIINYILIYKNVIRDYLDDIVQLNVSKSLYYNTVTSTKAKLEKAEQKITKLEKELCSQLQIIKKKQKALEEASEIIDSLSNRKLFYSGERDKKYYLDNFPKDIQEFLNDIIKEYYKQYVIFYKITRIFKN